MIIKLKKPRPRILGLFAGWCWCWFGLAEINKRTNCLIGLEIKLINFMLIWIGNWKFHLKLAKTKPPSAYVRRTRATGRLFVKLPMLMINISPCIRHLFKKNYAHTRQMHPSCPAPSIFALDSPLHQTLLRAPLFE